MDMKQETEPARREFPQGPILIAPSVLSVDFARLAEQVAAIEAAGAQVLHLDVMDGHFVPNISFGVPVIKSLRKCTKCFLDAHLMIADPKKYARPFVDAGCDHITFHIETAGRTADAEGAAAEIIDHVHSLGVSAGIALNPTTPAADIDSVLSNVELVLVMSVWPGFGGQSFIADVLPKTRELKKRLRPDQRLEIDGGIDANTIALAAAAGADTFVAGTAVFGQPDPPAVMKRLLELAQSAAAS